MNESTNSIRNYLLGAIAFIVILIVLPSLFIYYNEIEKTENRLVNESQVKLGRVDQFIESEIASSLQDLDFFKRNPAYSDYLYNDSSSYRKVIERTLATFGRIRNIYQQIRLVDTTGKEVLKITYQNGETSINLDRQNKRKEPYFKAMEALGPDEVYISSMDLNREFGKIQEPLYPIIRMATPIIPKNTKKIIGYIIINYNGQRILNMLKQMDKEDRARFILCNDEGYFIKALDTTRSFSFLLNDSIRYGAVSQFPRIWERWKDEKKGVIEGTFGMAYFEKIEPMKQYSGSSGFSLMGNPHYYVISVYQPRDLAEINSKLAGGLTWYGVLLLLFIVPVLLYLFRLINKKNKLLIRSTRHLKEQNEMLREARHEAEEATRVKGDFLATMSHEIRTPLNAVIGASSLLELTPLDEKQEEYVKIVGTSGESLLNVINDILDFSRLESGKMTVEKRPFNLNKMLEDTMQVAAFSAETKGVKFYYYLSPQAPDVIYGDQGRITQCLLNLLNNAIKFTKTGEVGIRVTVVETKDDIVKLKYSVIDTGIGIPRDKQDEIFEEFHQADTSITRRFGGTGLGLSITQRLIELMGGSIHLKSEKDKGSTFWFYLENKGEYLPPVEGFPSSEKVLIIGEPGGERNMLLDRMEAWGGVISVCTLQETENLESWNYDSIFILSEEGSHELYKELADKISGQGKEVYYVDDIFREKDASVNWKSVTRPIRISTLKQNIFGLKDAIEKDKPIENADLAKDNISILLAEDNPVNQKLGIMLFQTIGYEVDLVPNGLEAVKACENKRYDIVFMDVQMPEMDGVEATKQIIERLGENRPVIIALTANAMEGHKYEYLNKGMDDYLSKPISIKELEEALKKWRSRKQ